MNNYVTYHLHTMDSLLDSATSYKEYVDYAVELGQKAICFTEHGNTYNYFEKYSYCKEKGIKFLFGIEIYLTETFETNIRDNYHTILIAKNHDGFKEINNLIAVSTRKDHRYYKPRISFEEFLNISDNVIKISACLAGPLHSFKKRLDEAESNGEDVGLRREMYMQLCKHYDYYEIQYHGGEQVEYNKYLYELSKMFNKPLIAATDTHSINQYKAECRTILQYGKTDGDWGDGENSFDLTYKSLQGLIKAFWAQNALPRDVWMAAINETNVMADSVDEFEIDTALKYPVLYAGQDEEQIMWDRIHRMYDEKVKAGVIDGNNPQYMDNIKEEMRVFKKINMVGFMLFMSELMSWAREENIFTSPCRGSVGGSTVAYITDIIDVDPIIMHTIFSRFANEYRSEVGDVDVDFYEEDRPKVYQHMFDRFGERKCAYILATGTLADKAVIDTIGKAFRVMAEKNGVEEPYTLSDIKEIKAQWESDQEGTRKKYPDLFKYYDGLVGCVVSQSMHPAGIVVAPVDLITEYGVFYNTDEQPILSINMDEVHETGLVKYDILGLKNVGIISKTCSYAGVELPRSYKMNWQDEEVFKDMMKSPVGIFQFESSYGFDSLKQYYNSVISRGLKFTIDDMSICNGCIRPGGASFRNDLFNLKEHKNPSEMIDKLLESTHGYLCFQEQTIAFLQQICGLSGGAADNIRRAIGRKQIDRLEAALPDILNGYCSKSDQPREVAEAEAKEFLRIIEDSASYQFGFNHSTGYSMLGYLCAYYRYYYPIEFCTAFLNCSETDEDIYNGTMLAKQLGYKIILPKFREARGTWWFNKEGKIITKGLVSIKNLNAKVAEELYALRNNTYTHFSELLYDIKKYTSLKKDQREILIKINFFEEFGNVNKLMYIASMFDSLRETKSIRRDKLDSLLLTPQIMEMFSENITQTRIEEIDVERWLMDHGKHEEEILSKLRTPKGRYSTKKAIKMFDISIDDQIQYRTKVVIGQYSGLDNHGLLKYLEDHCTPAECSLENLIRYQQEYLGYIDYTNPELDSRYVVVTNLDTKYSPRFIAYCLKNGKTMELKIHSTKNYKDKSIITSFKQLPVCDGDIIYCKKIQKKARQKKVGDKWETVPDEFVWWVNDYRKVEGLHA